MPIQPFTAPVGPNAPPSILSQAHGGEQGPEAITLARAGGLGTREGAGPDGGDADLAAEVTGGVSPWVPWRS
ncbi:hypothetical protein [Dactylosporangium sp. NPDC005555]|uniref:hypothetical protein n=1 Tax=Dactylosporangium sp. NPDC005555 TaxID=3154889 RepID=UPI0033BA4286